MKVVSPSQKCPAGLSGRRPVSNGPMGRISGALANTYSSTYLNELQMMNYAILIARFVVENTLEHCSVGFHDRQCSSRRSELSSWAACWGRAGTSLAMLLLHLRTVLCFYRTEPLSVLVGWASSTASGDVYEFSSCNACQRTSHLLRRGAIARDIEGIDMVETDRVNRLAMSTTVERQKSKGRGHSCRRNSGEEGDRSPKEEAKPTTVKEVIGAAT
ncbi:hypothetical protein BHM03_00014724 [Ensete ventricosum]|nr:hypothetical protein BHM03_00014724 [Ensete ventricosum]